MQQENLIDNIISGLNGSVNDVFGSPIKIGDKTIIPVAGKAYGFGSGSGKGTGKNKTANNDSPYGEGSGGGGGIMLKPKGVYEITAGATRYIPVNPNRYVVMGLLAGIIIKSLLFKKSK